MMEALLTEEIVRRIVIAANQGTSPGSYRLALGQKEAARILQELREAEIEEMARHYGQETAGQ